MESENDIGVGFWFAMQLARTMGLDTEPRAIFGQLRSVARGDLSLLPSPEDALRELEKKTGHTLTDQERKYALSIAPNRAEQDKRNRELASMILRLMNEQI